MVVFSQIFANDVAAVEEALEIYAESFPANERHAAAVIRERVARGRYKLFAGREGDAIVFFALMWPLQGSEFVLLDYMATRSGHRGRGIGSAFLKSLAGMAELAGKVLMMEVEDPTLGENRDERLRRAAFYRRQGARELEGVRYFMPGLSGGAATEMILMVLHSDPPVRAREEMDSRKVRRVIVQIYEEVYGRDGQDQLLNSFLGEIRAKRIKLRR